MPITAAAFRGNVAIIEMLLSHGADARVPDQTGKAAIVYAAALGNVAVVTRRDNDGKSAFDLAANDSVRERLAERQRLGGESNSAHHPAR